MGAEAAELSAVRPDELLADEGHQPRRDVGLVGSLGNLRGWGRLFGFGTLRGFGALRLRVRILSEQLAGENYHVLFGLDFGYFDDCFRSGWGRLGTRLRR